MLYCTAVQYGLKGQEKGSWWHFFSTKTGSLSETRELKVCDITKGWTVSLEGTKQKMNEFVSSGAAETNSSIFLGTLNHSKCPRASFWSQSCDFSSHFITQGLQTSCPEAALTGRHHVWLERLLPIMASLFHPSIQKQINTLLYAYACVLKQIKILFPASTSSSSSSSSSSSRYLAFDLFASLFVFVIWRDVNLATPRDCTLAGDTKKRAGEERGGEIRIT